MSSFKLQLILKLHYIESNLTIKFLIANGNQNDQKNNGLNVRKLP